jgi:hypothetical protein
MLFEFEKNAVTEDIIDSRARNPTSPSVNSSKEITGINRDGNDNQVSPRELSVLLYLSVTIKEVILRSMSRAI